MLYCGLAAIDCTLIYAIAAARVSKPVNAMGFYGIEMNIITRTQNYFYIVDCQWLAYAEYFELY